MRLVPVLFLFFLSSQLFSQELTVEKIWKNYEFYESGVEGFRSMNDGNYFSKISGSGGKDAITKHHFEKYDGEGEVLVSSAALKGMKIDDYTFNRVENKVLIATDSRAIYRHSYAAVHYVFDMSSGVLQELDPQHKPQTLAEFSPDGTMVSYIFQNNMYVKTLATGKIKQLTKDGKSNAVINGTTDWVYEEEFAITKAYEWSHDSKYIAFLRFDERSVPEFSMTYYGQLYPEQYTFKYPKAGEVNSSVTAHLISAKGGKAKKITLGNYEYIPRLKWAGNANNLIIQTLNRKQNHLSYYITSVVKSKITTRMFFEEKSDTYIDIDNNLLVLADGKRIIRTSEADGYNHLYELSFDGKQRQVTKGNWDVIECYGIDEESETIYYSSAQFGPIHKSIFRIKINGGDPVLISTEQGTSDAAFSNQMRYFVKTYSSANIPPVYTLCDRTGKEIAVLENNFELIEKLSAYKLSPKEFITFEGYDVPLNGWIIKPVNFDPKKKYPVFLTIYGGPGSNTVSDSWSGMNYMYHQLLAQKGYIVVSVDPRGTMYRGAAFKKSTYLQLGKLETEDFIAVAQELQTYEFVDPARIGIMGWSYGGFMSSLAITKGADYFKMAIAVAPVTNWRFYDNIYTERFMQTPAENAAGYDDNSPINFTKSLKGKYLLIHGSGDDNVHYQNTMEMISALVESNKQFDLFIYPNKNHGIYGGNTRNHLFNLMLNYTLENL